jgi:D-glycero-D-manno-heptose 1,7-bisphosphate phosphatase
MSENKLRSAVFMDRDGTLIEDAGYIDTTDKIRLFPEAIEAVKLLNDAGYKTIIVSNQSGVARGYFSEDTAKLINNRVIELFAERGASIDAVYYCPHHPRYGNQNYRRDCECRKPKSGMILKAVKELDLDLSGSIMVGDKYTDVKTGKNLDLFSILVFTGYGRQEYQKMKTNNVKPDPDLVIENIYDAALFINSHFERSGNPQQKTL